MTPPPNLVEWDVKYTLPAADYHVIPRERPWESPGKR